MSAFMYTRCPQCRTVFHLSPQQLTERNGLVRCGQCASIFRADENFVEHAPSDTGSAPSHERNHPAPARPDAPSAELPTPRELLLGRTARARTRPVFWVLGNILLLGALLAQIVYFNASELARRPVLQPYVIEACALLGCVIQPPRDVNLIELSDTRVTPHRKYRDALSIRAVLINRAGFTQPFPRMEITLTDRNGDVVARRSFDAQQYLVDADKAGRLMPPNVAIRASLEITNPDRRAEGYEIRLVPS